ncbi:MAG: TrkA C-terminal domain-containing protein [Candidatus Competibacteraceae bacterium]|nr:TrkA C-terminal domain-containing protein [Candidatus Competibacteraceae bacterium]
MQLRYRVRIVATHFHGRTRLSTPVDVRVEGPAVLAVIGDLRKIHELVQDNRLRLRTRLHTFMEALLHTQAGVAELVIPPNSGLIGKSARDLRMRETYWLTLLTIHRAGRSMTEGLPEILLQGGDTLVCHTAWDALARLDKNRDFVVITSEYPHEEERPHKLYSALGCFALAMALALLTEMRRC